MIELYEHQKIGSSLLLKNKKFCLFFEVGTGKTFTALDALFHLDRNMKVLIVSTRKSIDLMWTKITEYNMQEFDITYTTYDIIARNSKFNNTVYDVVILDEVHRIKGKTTKSSQRIKRITKYAEYVWGLTGTPVANNYADVYQIFSNMNIIEFDMTRDEFITTYYFTKSLQVTNNYSILLPLSPKPSAIENLMHRIGKHSIVKLMRDCHDLPDLNIREIFVSGMCTKQYKDIFNGIVKTDDYEQTITKLASINKARQASNGYFYDLITKEPIKIKDNIKLTKCNDLIEDILEETDKIILVYFFKEDLDQLRTSIEVPFTLDPYEFEHNAECKILMLQYAQCESLNLQFCSNMIFYTYDYSFLKFEQMVGRIKRIGQENKMNVYVLINKDTIEEKVWHAIKYKQSTDEFLKGVLSE